MTHCYCGVHGAATWFVRLLHRCFARVLPGLDFHRSDSKLKLL